MRGDFVTMTKTNEVPVLELKRLLHSLKDSRPDICVRFRLMGEMWQSNHMRIIDIDERGVALNDEAANKLVFIRDLSHVMQFELDRAFQQYQPHYHYSVSPEIVS